MDPGVVLRYAVLFPQAFSHAANATATWGEVRSRRPRGG